MIQQNDIQTEQNHLLIVDDDNVFLRVLSRAMEKFGYTVSGAQSLDEVKSVTQDKKLSYAIVDLHLKNRSETGLDIIKHIKNISPTTTIIMLSGYANISTVVSAVKLGAVDCLTKPADPEQLHHTLMTKGNTSSIPIDQMTVKEPSEIRLQHIISYWEKNERNTSQTAKILKMHRRTLQRILDRAGIGRSKEEAQETYSPFTKLRRLYTVWSKHMQPQVKK